MHRVSRRPVALRTIEDTEGSFPANGRTSGRRRWPFGNDPGAPWQKHRLQFFHAAAHALVRWSHGAERTHPSGKKLNRPSLNVHQGTFQQCFGPR
jgi:hypothetical protein